MGKKSQKEKETKRIASTANVGKMADNSIAGYISSPSSTGGAGIFFEQHVDAYWLAQLLVGCIPPILLDCSVREVHLQTEHLGWHTDDFLIVGQNGSGDLRKLIGQVKRKFTVSSTDDECKKTIQDFWKDFKNSQQFLPATDRFALITLRGTNTLLEHFSGLLDCSRAAPDGREFERRLAKPGFISIKALHYCNEIREIISEMDGKSFSVEEVWPFLRVLHILSLDFNSATCQTEAIIKTLLAYTTGEQDAISAADATWNALLREIGDGMPEARRYLRGDLPKVLQERHSPVSSTEHRALRALSDHSVIILDGIRSMIGKEFHLGRDRLVQEVIEQLESTQVVLISGAAGSGKSSIAKDVIGILTKDHVAFSFRAEEFARPHFDETLQSNQIPANAAMLGAVLAGQGRKIMLIESVERLLEKSTRDAFTDLLTLVRRDKSWCLVLTCRDYSVDLVRSAFLESAKVGHSVVTVPLLNNEELEDVKAAYPAMARPLSNAALCQLLRNPYILDKALQIRWSEEYPLPQSEREFRTLFWQEIVCVEHNAFNGMPLRRENIFVQIALRRARALTPYISCDDLDAEVVSALQHDSLVAPSPKNRVLVAPAHDVLEDWAILQWIDKQHAVYDGLVRELSVAIGTHPAVRRTYRKWVSELMGRDPNAADKLFQDVIHEAELPAQFRDDTIISLLRSPASVAFLERHHELLFANDKQFLKKVIHLLRVACVTTPAWLETSKDHLSLFDVPEGTAWACVLRIVQSNLGVFTDDDHALLLAFIEDWARGVSWQTPYPDGAESVAAIAQWLLPNFDNYQSREKQRRTLKVIAKIPNADHEHFTALLLGNPSKVKRDRAEDEFREIIFEGIEGMPAARDMPNIVVTAANDYLLCSEADLRREKGYTGLRDLEPLFGIKENRSSQFFPASAYRGPFFHLLRYHPSQGLTFIINIFNHSADWYAHPRVHTEYVEPPFEMALTFADGGIQTQWNNTRLWDLYRGISFGPNILQSLLMALERWLLEFAEARSHELDAILLDILQKSSSAAITAVVASVATAFPHASGETLLVLLQSRLCVILDRQRLANESKAPSKMYSLMPRIKAGDEFYYDERKNADELSHRRHDLETAIVNLQLGPLAPRVHEILDRLRAKMPAVEEQEDNDRTWRLAMHRMDLRQYTLVEDAAKGSISPEDPNSPGDSRQNIHLDLKVPDPDVKEMVEQSAAKFQSMNARISLLMWGQKVFNYEDETTYDPTQWQERLQEVIAAGDAYTNTGEYELGRGILGFLASICIRDHWEELTGDEQQWCVTIICSEVEWEANNWNRLARMQRYSMEGDRPCAYVLPLLLGKSLGEVQESRVRQVLVIALTHAIDEVRSYGVLGIGKYLWDIDRDLTQRCMNALAMEATLIQQAASTATSSLYYEPQQFDKISVDAATFIRQRFFEADAIADNAYQAMDPNTLIGAETNRQILTILGQASTEDVAITAFQRLAITLVGWWDSDDVQHQEQHQERYQRNYETETALTDLLKNFLLRTTTTGAISIIKPILSAIDHHPDKVYWILIGLIGIEDRQPNTPQFWLLWELFADRVRSATWLGGIDNEHAWGTQMMSAIFLGYWWKDDVRHWRSLEGYASHIHALFDDLPASSIVLDDYLRFLDSIGEQSLPDAFIRIANRLKQGDPRQMMRKSNTVFLLEDLLQRYVYGRPLELKRERKLREAVLYLLDILVENGPDSSAAFRMRDDFVTPFLNT
jgi:energy-coupling factor transporter ATP-binding protein EcfA2